MREKKKLILYIVILFVAAVIVALSWIALTRKNLSNVELFRHTLDEDEPVIENPIDDSVLSDPIPRDENNYIKDSTDEDVVYDAYGFPYIKNQIVFLTDLGTDKQIIEKMVSEMDADIVGYIQSICFYQIEFRSDKSSEELEELIELIEGHEYIMYAGLNSVDEEGQIQIN